VTDRSSLALNRRQFAATAAAALLVTNARAELGEGPEEVPWLDEVQRPPERLPDDAPPLASLLLDRNGREIADRDAWEERRAELRAEWLAFLGPLDSPRDPPRLQVLEEDRPAGCVRQLVRYESEPGIPVEGYLLKPDRLTGRAAGVVAMHSTVDFTIRQPAGLEGDAEDHFGLKLAQRGIVAFCPRCFLWQGEGDYLEQVARFEARHSASLGMAKMLHDAVRAVDVLAGLPDVDADRLGAVGHSLGAKEALYLAAFDERIKATVSSEGGVGTGFSNWEAPWYLGPALKEGRWTREHHEVLALVAPRAFLLLGGDSADGDRSWPFIAANLPVWRLYGERPRLGLFNHRRGHSVPPEAERRVYEWLTTYLGGRQ
jgi:hypothetical protein